MEKIGVINQREIFYLNHRDNPFWQFSLPESNWLLFAIVHEEDVSRINEFSEKCLDKKVCYICGTGQAGSTLEDIFDLELLNRNIQHKGKELTDQEEVPLSSWHEDLDEGFWFAATVANHSVLPIHRVICINLSKIDYRNRILNLIKDIHNGWQPV